MKKTRNRQKRHAIHAVWIVIGVSLATFALEHLGWLDRFETAGLDTFNLLQSSRTPSDVVIIAINDQDYEALFAASSPLRCDRLKEILSAIAAGGPAVIGVDIDTSSTTRIAVANSPPELPFACLQDLDADWPPIVWAEDATWDPERRTFTPVPTLSGNGHFRGKDRIGLVALPQDPDRVIRRYYRELPLTSGGTGATLPWAIMQSACVARFDGACTVTQGSSSHDGVLRLNFAGERFDFEPLSASHVIDITSDHASRDNWQQVGPLKGRIVLLGGSYRAARETQLTPVGPMSGVKILAQAIEGELKGGGIRELNQWIALLLDLASGFLLVWVGYLLRDRPVLALTVNLVLVPVLSLTGSLIAFSTFALWFNFVTVVASVFIHQLYEHVQEYRRLRARHR